MRLVENAKRAWSWFSVQALAAIILLPVVWPTLPPSVTSWVPESWRPWVIVLIAAGGLVGRLVDQEKKAPPA